MTYQETLKEIISNILHIDKSEIENDFNFDTAKEFDSFNHLVIITEIEEKTGIRFTIAEVEGIKLYKELEETVARKMKGKTTV